MKLGLFAFYLAYSVFFVGLVFHRQGDPAIGPYSLVYLCLLLVLASLYGVPVAIVMAIRRHGARRVGFALAPLAGLAVVGYVASSIAYANLQSHHFDPFLQIHPPDFDVEDIPRVEGSLRILTLGGSTTENGLLPPDARYPRVLEVRLAEALPQLDVEVLNAGRAWYTSKHSLINFVTNMRAWKPDVVVTMHGMNDLYRSFADPSHSVGDYNRHWSHFYGASIHGAEPPTLEDLLVGAVAKRWFSRFRIHEEDLPLDQYVSRERSREFLTTLVRAVRAEGGTPVLMTQPSLFKDAYTEGERRILTFGEAFCKVRRSYFDIAYPSPDSLRRAMLAQNEAVREVARANDVVLADLADVVPKDLAHFTDDVHYTPAGAKALAEALARTLVEDRVVP